MYPILVENQNELINKYFIKGIEIGSHFNKSIKWALQYGYQINDCENTEKIVNQIVTFPTYYKLNVKQ